jgi:hypothetical protein
MELVEAIYMVIDASVPEVLSAIKDDSGEEQIEIVADSLAWLAVMLKHGGDLVE